MAHLRHPFDGANPVSVESSLSPAAERPPQQCGRYRLLFEGDPTLQPAPRPDWWLSPPGGAIPLGRTPHPHDVAHRRHVGETP